MWNRFKKSIHSISPYIFTRENSWRLTAGSLASLLSSGLNFGVSWLGGQAISMLATQQKTVKVLGVEVDFNTILYVGCSAYVVNRVVINGVNQILAPIPSRAFKKLIHDLSDHALHRSLEDKSTPGEDMVRLQKGCNAVSTITNQLCGQFPTLLSISISSGILTKSYGAVFGGGLMVAVVGCAVYNVHTAKKIVDLRGAARDAGNESYEDLMRTFNHSTTIQASNREKYEIKRVDRSLEKMTTAEINTSAYNNKISQYQESFLGALYSVMTIYAAYQVKNGQLQAADFATIQLLVTNFLTSFHQFGIAVSQTVSSGADADNVFRWLEESPSVINYRPDVPFIVQPGNASIEFKNVKFKYKNKTTLALNDVSFIVHPGQIIGLTGESGSGKTTCGKLIFRSLDTSEGNIFIAGHEIKSVCLDSLRQNIAIIEQEPVLLGEMTIFENIAYGSPHFPAVKPEDVYEAADRAGLSEFIKSLEHGFDEKLVERGSNLSGGQKQRLAIARAIIKNASILICDEATSALDANTALGIQKTLTDLASNRGMTVIKITHCLRDLVTADNVIVFDKGQTVEQGVHPALVARNGIYAKLWRDQSKDLARLEEKSSPTGMGCQLHRFFKLPQQSGPVVFHIKSPPIRAMASSSESVVLDIRESQRAGESGEEKHAQRVAPA